MKTKTTLDLRKVSLLSRKKVKIIAGVLAVAVVSGGILVATGMVQANYKGIINFFSKVTGTANVSQSIKLDDHVYGVDAAWTYTANDIVAGETVFNGPHFIRNTASVPIKVTLETDPNPDSLTPSPVERVWHNVQITTGAEYVRNPSFFKADDGAYWLFYTQDTNTSQNGYGCDALGAPGCDSDIYDIYYVISLDQGETWSGPIAMATANLDSSNKRRDVSAFQDSSGKIWVFVADGASGGQPVFYLTSSDNGATWSGTTQVTTTGNHISALEVNSYIVLFYNGGGATKLVYTSDNGATWSGAVIADTRGGVMKAIHSNDNKIKVAWENSGNGIYMSTCDDSTFGTASNWETTAGPIVQTVVSGYGDYDPCLYQDVNGKYWLFYAPWGGSNTQWINYVTSASGSVDTWSQPKILMERTGLWNMWPVVSEDDSGNMMVFYTSENNYNSARVNGNIWLAKSGNWWNGNVPMEITIPASEWVGADISNVFKDDTGANAYSTVTTVKK